MQNQVFCRFCGKSMPASSQFCPYCGKSQSLPAAAATPPMEEAPAAQGQPGIGKKKGALLPIVLAVVAGAFALCCVGLLLYQVILRDRPAASTRATAAPRRTSTPETAATRTSASSKQNALSEKWTPAFTLLYAAEQHYAETITRFERVQAGTLSRESYLNQLAVPDAYDLLLLGYFQSEEADIEALSEKTAIKYTETRPLVLTLEDDFETILEVEMLWFGKEIDEMEALNRLRQGQQDLLAERDKMYRAATMDGLTDKTYALIQTSIEEQWPALKAKLDALGIRLLTPVP